MAGGGNAEGASAHHPGRTQVLLCETPTGRTMTCWFCPDCGTRLYHDPGGELGREHRNLKPGTLDDATWLPPVAHFFTRSMQPWVAIPDDALRYEAMPGDRKWLPD
ncbi:GFA family protein [Belnapia mucosa]